MWDYDMFSVVDREDGKYLVFTGYFYYMDDMDEEHPYRYIEVNKGFGLEEKLPIDKEGFWDRLGDCRQHVYDLTQEEAEFCFSHYYDNEHRPFGTDWDLMTDCGHGVGLPTIAVNEYTPAGSYHS